MIASDLPCQFHHTDAMHRENTHFERLSRQATSCSEKRDRDEMAPNSFRGREKLRRSGSDLDHFSYGVKVSLENYAEVAAKARIVELLHATDFHKNNVFPSLFPYLKELGWKYAVDEHSSTTVFLTPWASKIDGAILLDGHCSLGRLGHNFDYFVDGQSAVTYLRTYGFNRTLRPASLSAQAVAVGRKRCNEQNVIVHGTARSQKSNSSGQ